MPKHLDKSFMSCKQRSVRCIYVYLRQCGKKNSTLKDRTEQRAFKFRCLTYYFPMTI